MTDKETKIVFIAHELLVKPLRTPKRFRFEADLPEIEWPAVRDVNAMPEGNYRITIEPIQADDLPTKELL